MYAPYPAHGAPGRGANPYAAALAAIGAQQDCWSRDFARVLSQFRTACAPGQPFSALCPCLSKSQDLWIRFSGQVMRDDTFAREVKARVFALCSFISRLTPLVLARKAAQATRYRVTYRARQSLSTPGRPSKTSPDRVRSKGRTPLLTHSVRWEVIRRSASSG